jgi:hypothetical protein
MRRCEICGMEADPHEICSRGSGGPRAAWNQIDLCVPHHTEAHTLGWVKFGERYPRLYGKIVSAREMMGRRTTSRDVVVEV